MEEDMIVKFLNTWHVPGFGRKRFLKGTTVRDVPEALRKVLPKSAEILPDNVVYVQMLENKDGTRTINIR